MLPSTNDEVPFFPNIPSRFSHVISYVDFNQDNDKDNPDDDKHSKSVPTTSTLTPQQQPKRQTPTRRIPTPRLLNSSLVVSSSLLKDTTITFTHEKEEPKANVILDDDDIKQSRTDSTPPAQIIVITSDRSQQTSALDMPFNLDEDNDDTTVVSERQPRSIVNRTLPHHRSHSEQRHSEDSGLKPSSSEEQASTVPAEDDREEHSPANQLKSILTVPTIHSINRRKPVPMIKPSHQKPISTSTSIVTKKSKSSSLKYSSSMNTPRSMAIVPSISRRGVQGVLVRFFRIGDEYHHGVKIAINEFDLKSWEAFLNYLNRQPKLLLSTGGIRHIYTMTGQEVRSINKFQHRQSYVVSSGGFYRTNFRYINDSFNEETDTNFNSASQQESLPYWNTRSSVHQRWRSPPVITNEQIFLLPYSRLNMYESLILNRNNSSQTFDEWLQDQVTDLLSHYNNDEYITHLFAITRIAFIEVKSFSKLHHMVKLTDTFIGCTEDEYVHAKHYFETIKPSELFLDRVWSRKAIEGHQSQRYPSKRAIEDVKITLNWIHGYNGENDLTKSLYTLPENEILYVIGSICIIYESNLKQQRFYIKHTQPITGVAIHQYQTLVASSELGATKGNQRALVHIWDHINLRTITEIRKEQFGSYINLVVFSPKSDDNLLLIVSRDKPHIVLFVDWERNELIYSITCKSDYLLSVLFVFESTEWIACLSQRHLLFYHINWSLRPLRMLERRESEVQNVYTGAAACDTAGERLLVGDKVGSVHVWRLVDGEPKLIVVQENILESEIETIVPISQEAFVLANGDNQIKIWNVKLNTVEQIRINENIGSIRSICCIRRGLTATALAIGTKLNYIISKDIASEQFDAIMRGHTGPSICLCSDKESQYFFSISSDRHLFKWNNRTKAVEWSAKSTQPISCADLHPERNIIVLGSETSKLLIYDTLSSYYIATITLKMNTSVKSVRFSPDGSYLAVGLQNGNICMFDVLGNGDFHPRSDGILQNDSAAVSSLIWSTDSMYLLGIYADNDYNIWSIPSFDIVRGKAIQTIPWYRVVHPIMCNQLDKLSMDTHTSAVNLSPNLALCCGKDGQLRLFRNRYEGHCQTFQFGLGPIQNIIPSGTNETFLLSMKDNSVIVEIQVNLNSHFS